MKAGLRGERGVGHVPVPVANKLLLSRDTEDNGTPKPGDSRHRTHVLSKTLVKKKVTTIKCALWKITQKAYAVQVLP